MPLVMCMTPVLMLTVMFLCPVTTPVTVTVVASITKIVPALMTVPLPTPVMPIGTSFSLTAVMSCRQQRGAEQKQGCNQSCQSRFHIVLPLSDLRKLSLTVDFTLINSNDCFIRHRP